jgi:hypothetical protein
MQTQSRPAPPSLTATVNKQRLYLLLAGAVLGYGVMYFFLGRVELILLGICVVVAIIYGLKQAFSDDTRVVIDQSGVLDSRLGLGTIRWRDITNVYMTQLHNIPHICLEVEDANRYLKNRSTAVKALLKFHQAANDITPFNINTGVLDAPAGDIYNAILANRQFYADRNVTSGE